MPEPCDTCIPKNTAKVFKQLKEADQPVYCVNSPEELQRLGQQVPVLPSLNGQVTWFRHKKVAELGADSTVQEAVLKASSRTTNQSGLVFGLDAGAYKAQQQQEEEEQRQLMQQR
jgi:hypothetical protein